LLSTKAFALLFYVYSVLLFSSFTQDLPGVLVHCRFLHVIQRSKMGRFRWRGRGQAITGIDLSKILGDTKIFGVGEKSG